MPFLNFLIDLALQADGQYCITVQSSPVGEATVTVSSPFSPDNIQNALATFGRRRQGLTRVEETQAARQFGERLFNFLIRHNEDVNAAYFASLDRAGHEWAAHQPVAQQGWPPRRAAVGADA